MKKGYYILLLFSATLSAQLQWRPLTSILTNVDNQRFDDIFFLNENLGWAANGAYAAIYKTTDGGATWSFKGGEGTTQFPGNWYFRNVEFLDENIGFLGTLDNTFFKTTDGGDSWAAVNAFGNNPQSVCGMDAVGTSTLYGCGAYFSPAFVIKTTDSGLTWTYIDMSQYASALVEVVFVDENIGYVSGNDNSGALILKTTDGGLTWTSIYNSNIPGEYVWKLQTLASNPNVVFGSIESVAPFLGRLIKSTDSGATWISKDAPETMIQGMGFLSENHGWMGGHTTGFYETNNGGDTWANTNVGSNLNRIFIISDQLAYAAGSTVYKFSELPLGTGDFKETPRIPLKAYVEPNPVKDKLNIRIEFNGSDHLNLELYDAAGHHIKLLQRDNITAAASKSYSFDFPYASGVYLLDIHTNTGRQTIKFVK